MRLRIVPTPQRIHDAKSDAHFTEGSGLQFR